jgi:hypothetical protein
MTVSALKDVLLWCVLINYLLLIIWVAIVAFAHDWFFRWNTRWFKIGVEHFDAINFAGIAFYKIGIILLNLVPLIALYLSSS